MTVTVAPSPWPAPGAIPRNVWRFARPLQAADGMPGAWEMLEDDMHQHLPTFIADTTDADVRGSKYYPLRQTSLWPLIKDHYRPVATIDKVTVYKRNTGVTSAH